MGHAGPRWLTVTRPERDDPIKMHFAGSSNGLELRCAVELCTEAVA